MQIKQRIRVSTFLNLLLTSSVFALESPVIPGQMLVPASSSNTTIICHSNSQLKSYNLNYGFDIDDAEIARIKDQKIKIIHFAIATKTDSNGKKYFYSQSANLQLFDIGLSPGLSAIWKKLDESDLEKISEVTANPQAMENYFKNPGKFHGGTIYSTADASEMAGASILVGYGLGNFLSEAWGDMKKNKTYNSSCAVLPTE